MIQEIFQYLTTPCSWKIRQMGYLSEWIGIRSRYGRCQKDWEPHLQNCKRVIRETLRRHSEVKRVAFCGSGWGLDLPWESEEFRKLEKIILVDLLHPWSIHLKGWLDSRVEVVTCDLSGVIEELEDSSLPQPHVGLDLDVDLVVSLNLIGQLPLLPLEYLEGKPNEESLRNWARAIQTEHLRCLKEWAPRQLMIADVRESWVARGGESLEVKDPWNGLRDFEMDEEWDWVLAPRGEIDAEKSKVHRVGVKFFTR